MENISQNVLPQRGRYLVYRSWVHTVIAIIILLLIASSCTSPTAEVDEQLVIEWTADNSIVCYGNSLTVGVVDPDSSYPAFLDDMLKIDVVTRGRIGAMSEWGLENIDTVFSADPVLVILEFGGNDLLAISAVDSAYANLAAMIEIILDYGAEVALLNFANPDMVDCALGNPLVRPHLDNLPPGVLDAAIALGLQYSAMINNLAAEYDLLLEDYLYEGIDCDSTMLNWDVVHPNAKGNQRMAENVYEALYDVFERSDMLN